MGFLDIFIQIAAGFSMLVFLTWVGDIGDA